VLIQVWLKGREMAHAERGDEMLRRFIEDLKDISKVESPIRREGKRMHLLLTPLTAEERNSRKKQLEKEKEKAAEQRLAAAKAKAEEAKKAEAEKATS
jgi:hypothetical protein